MKNKDTYKINVIVPVYNGAEHLTETIEALITAGQGLAQIILIDDGSTDGSDEICVRYQQNVDGILYYRKANGGIVSARNMGLEMAAGEYVCFCDQDDLVEPDFFSILYRRIRENDCEVAICGTNRMIQGARIPCERFQDLVLTGSDILEELIKPVLFYGTDLGKPANERFVGSIWKCMIKKEMIRKWQIHFRRYVNYEDDLLFYMDVLTHANRVCTLSYSGYNWRINHSSETYNWKFIEDYPQKYKLFIKDMQNMAATVCDCPDVMECYSQYQLCNMFEELLINEGSVHNARSFRQKIKYIKEMMRDNDYKNVIRFRKHINAASVQKRITLTLLGHGYVRLAYLWRVNYKRIREKAIKSKYWFLMEKWLKDRTSRIK